jgi:hypothetical protein
MRATTAQVWREAKRGGSTMLDLPAHKELAALAYERAEAETEQELILLAADGEEHVAPAARWYHSCCPARAQSYAELRQGALSRAQSDLQPIAAAQTPI